MNPISIVRGMKSVMGAYACVLNLLGKSSYGDVWRRGNDKSIETERSEVGRHSGYYADYSWPLKIPENPSFTG